MKKLLFASKNKGKIYEVKSFLKDIADVISLEEVDIPDGFEVVERGDTLEKNAYLKAKAYFDIVGLPTIADDTGLFVKALNGAPGIYSRRWVKGSDEDRNKALLSALSGFDDRRATFKTVFCLINSKGKEFYFTGELEGNISHSMKGQFGFGYDPVFIPKGMNKTIAQLPMKIKNKISSRAQALTKLKNFLMSLSYTTKQSL